MTRAKNSSWRNWAINGCFLASGLMIGLKGGSISKLLPQGEDGRPVAKTPAEADGQLDSKDSMNADLASGTASPIAKRGTNAISPEDLPAAPDKSANSGESGESNASKGADVSAKSNGSSRRGSAAIGKPGAAAVTPPERSAASEANSSALTPNDMRVQKRRIEPSMPQRLPANTVCESTTSSRSSVARPATQANTAPVEVIPIGGPEIIRVRPVTRPEPVRPVSAANENAVKREAEEREEAVKEIENELQRLQRALKELKRASQLERRGRRVPNSRRPR